MSLENYVTGLIVIFGIGAPIAYASIRCRARLFPAWRGAEARLVEVILGSAMLFAVAQSLGAFGAFKRWPMVIASVVTGAVAAFVADRGRSPERPEPAERQLDRAGLALAVVVIAYVVALWSLGTFVAFNAGPVDVDTQTYHLSHAARFVQDGWLTRLHFATADNAIPYHPFNSEVAHALGMLAFGTDVLTPFMNLGWLCLLFLAAWAIGERWRLGPATVTAVATLLVTELMVGTQAGSAMNDTMGLFYFLAAIALVIRSVDDEHALVIGGLAAGLALSTKLSFAAPVGLLTIAVVVLARLRKKSVARAAACWALPMIATGSYWFVRNLFRVGNPLPALEIGIGPLSFRRVPILLVDRYGYSVSDYLFDASVWREAFFPGVKLAFGLIWPIVTLFPVVALIALVVTRRKKVFVALGIVGLLAGVAYVFTPTTALGTLGKPTLFAANLRYLMPSLAIGLTLGTVLAWRSKQRTWPAAAFFTVVVAFGSTVPSWPPGLRQHMLKGVAVFVLMLGAAGALWVGRRIGPRPRMALLALASIVVAVGGSAVASTYVERRYTTAGNYAPSSGWFETKIFLWAQGVHDARIGTAGTFVNYPLFGSDLSNDVSYVGDLRADGEFTDLRSCAAWRRAVNEGRYAYLVIMPPFPDRPAPPQIEWTRSDPAVRQVLEVKKSAVFRVTEKLDPDACPR